MGATGWLYVVPYEPDIQKALDKLRQEVFESEMYRGTAKYLITMYQGMYDEFPPDLKAFHDAEIRELQALPKPRTIEEALSRIDSDGTHTILDIKSISDTPNYFTASPLSSEELIATFGTEKPMQAMIEDREIADEMHQYRYRNEAVYIVLYENGVPTEILFSGYTGD